MNTKNGVIKDQLGFFNENASRNKPVLTTPFFTEYDNKEQIAGFRWLGDRKRILDYGCGTGNAISTFFKENPGRMTSFVGVDIAEQAIQKSKKQFPDFTFYTITDNHIRSLEDASMDGAYLLCVLHHSHEHKAIFREIYSKLEKGGKFFLDDLSSNNPFVRFCRGIFLLSPGFVKRRFLDDLVVDGNIPEKYKVDPGKVIKDLVDAGFTIQEVGYGQWGVFLLGWFDRFIPLSRISFFRALYRLFWRIEDRMMKLRCFQKTSEVFYIKCIK
jgi:SAM-dependent methyltransferase